MFLPLAVAAAALLVTYLYSQLRFKRFKQYTMFPQMPPSLFLGHLKHIDQFLGSGKPRGHPDLAFAAINEALGRPPLMFLDLRPFSSPMVVVRSHEIAEQVARPSKTFPYSVPKMPLAYSHIVHVIGSTSISASNGEDWKQVRKRFNAGFAPQHLITMLPVILEKSFTFLEHLDHFASSGQTFSLVHLTGNLTIDIISSVAMDRDFGAQNTHQQGEFILDYQELLNTFASEQMDLPWYLTPRTEWKRRRLVKRMRNILSGIVREAFLNRHSETNKSRSILSLSLQDIDVLTAQAVDETCDQLSTFLFAGHDTTGILLSWMLYELSRTPHARQALREELDSLFGPHASPSTVRSKLLSPGGNDLLNHMPYASAVIKETLRLWPPAGTARQASPGAGLVVRTEAGEEYPLDGVQVYSCQFIIQRDPAVYGDSAAEFVPERWLHGAGSNIPAAAWRPFERGPRNCIGQELAMLEARVVLALVAGYDFVKVGIGKFSLDEAGKPISDDNGHFKVDEEMYPTRQVTPKPIDGMLMRILKG